MLRRNSASRRFGLPRRKITRNRLLRTESLESREMLSAAHLLPSYASLRDFLPASSQPAPRVVAPSVMAAVNTTHTLASSPSTALASVAITAAAGTTVSGVTEQLAAQGFNSSGNALSSTSLSYSWFATTLPSGARAPIFSLSGNNAAANTTATFSKAGVYGLEVRATDASGHTAISTMTVTVTQTFTAVCVTPGCGTLVKAAGQRFSAIGLDQFGAAMAAPVTVTWSASTVPSGAAAPSFSANGSSAAGNTTATFSRAGNYGVTATLSDANHHVLSASTNLTVTPALSSVLFTSGAAAVVAGTTVQLAAEGLDQFGNVLSSTLTYTWSATTLPSGARSPSFSASGSSAAAGTVATFSKAGVYGLTVKIADASGLAASGTITVTVNQTMSGVALDVSTLQLAAGGIHQFTARGLDQFQNAMIVQPSFTWAASAGRISGAGLFTAPTATGSATVTATSGALRGASTVTMIASSAGFLGIQDPALAGLVQSLDADGSISRNDMIRILDSVAAGSTVSATDYADLKTILSRAATLDMPGYVRVLAGDVVNGNAANAHYQGQALGNLAAGCSASRLIELVDKWFLGTDHPNSDGYAYSAAAGSLFGSGPRYTDVQQGELGDCYFIATLGTIAKSNPAAITNMFIANGDGTWTVRFYANGVADYVTVDNMLPTDSYGNLIYAGLGDVANNSSNKLWIPLAEKAYAQWNETGLEGRNGQNDYASIAGGWMGDVDAQVLGSQAAEYGINNATKQIMIAALAANQAVTTGTNDNPNNGLYGDHAYLVIGYNSATDTFTLYNPWGYDQPGALSWSQLEASCTDFAVANTAGTAPISAVPSALAGAAAELARLRFFSAAAQAQATAAAFSFHGGEAA